VDALLPPDAPASCWIFGNIFLMDSTSYYGNNLGKIILYASHGHGFNSM
jgi:hypothetical protein